MKRGEKVEFDDDAEDDQLTLRRSRVRDCMNARRRSGSLSGLGVGTGDTPARCRRRKTGSNAGLKERVGS